MLIRCEKCGYPFFTQDKAAWVGSDGDEEGEQSKCPECGAMNKDPEESFVRPENELPPFAVDHSYYGLEVYIGFEDADGGRWALKDRDSEEQFRKMLQEAVNNWEEAVEEEDETQALEGLRRAVHFLLSYSVSIGWHILVPKELMDKLNGVDAQRSRPSTTSVSGDFTKPFLERVDRVACPSCSGDQVVLREHNRTTARRDFYISDGRIHVGECYGEELDSDPENSFYCRVCGHEWPMPPHVADLVEW